MLILHPGAGVSYSSSPHRFFRLPSSELGAGAGPPLMMAPMEKVQMNQRRKKILPNQDSYLKAWLQFLEPLLKHHYSFSFLGYQMKAKITGIDLVM